MFTILLLLQFNNLHESFKNAKLNSTRIKYTNTSNIQFRFVNTNLPTMFIKNEASFVDR